MSTAVQIILIICATIVVLKIIEMIKEKRQENFVTLTPTIQISIESIKEDANIDKIIEDYVEKELAVDVEEVYR